ncbi:MAG: sodium-dependent transporter [Bacteroidales bacterium]|nr:sodium-dependent transporter [Bacteroidales bacterium]
MTTQSNTRGFTSNIGAILAAAGGAVGLGNIWRFPYTLGNNGGGAFLLVYVFFVLLIGIPLMMTEFIIGRRSQKDPIGAYRTLAPKHKGWMLIGIFNILGALLIYAFYSVVAGWTLNYVVLSCGNQLGGCDSATIAQKFAEFTQGSFWPLFYQFLFLVLTAAVVFMGVQKGIEKMSKILMPALFILLILMCVRSLTLGDGVRNGLNFLFKPDFSKIDGHCLLSALGQSFFSLSIGMGAMVTYGSYIRKEDKLFNSSLWIAGCDSLVAILAGVVIFPAVFAFGMSPAAGPELVYIVLPNVFNSMPGGAIFAVVFFLLLTIAALTSTISLLEILVATLVEEFHWKRSVAAVVSSLVVFTVGAFCTLSFGPLKDVQIHGFTIFDLFDRLTASYLMPIGALAMTIFLGWFFPKAEVRDELSNGGTLKVKAFDVYYFILRYVAPIALIIILVSGLIGK